MSAYTLFSHKYAEHIKSELRSGFNLERLSKDTFESDFDGVKMIEAPTLDDASHLLNEFPIEELKSIGKRESKYKQDFQTAIALFENYPNLTPLQAANSDFWMTLTFRDLFPYMQVRWRDVMEPGFNNIKYLNNHWIPGNKLVSHGLAGLWWAVKQSIDEQHTADKYWLTKELFRYIEFRVFKFGSKPIFSYKPAVQGILQFMIESPVFADGEKRGVRINYVAQFLTRWDNVKLLTFKDRDYFYNELKSIEAEIEKADSRKTIHSQLSDLDF